MPETPSTKRALAALIIIAVAFILLALLGCKSSRPIENQSRTDTTALRHDTLFLFRTSYDTLHTHDSIYIREIQRGDTILITKFRDRYLYKVVERHDTLYKASADSLAATRIEYKVVEKQVARDYTAWEKFRLKWFGVAVAVALALVVWVARKPIWKLVKKIV